MPDVVFVKHYMLTKGHYILLSSILTLFGCIERNAQISQQILEKEIESVYNKAVEIRKHLHQYPELAGNEASTKAYIINYLDQLGIEVKTGIYGHSVIGILKGDKNGKNIAWRSDMDAITTQYPDAESYPSKTKGIQHGCGHDVHMAIGLGLAEMFSKHKQSLAGTLYFIFQSEEETFLGARGLIENGLMDIIAPDEIYALHVTALPSGQIMVKENELYAYQKRLEIKCINTISNDEAHGLYNEIKEKMSRFSDDQSPWLVQNAFDAESGLNQPNTVFKNYCFMDENPYIVRDDSTLMIRAFLYETDYDNTQNIIPDIKDFIANGDYGDMLISVSCIQENPTVLNDPALTENSIKIFREEFGDSSVVLSHGQVPYFNDDFCYFQNEIPGVYFLFGGSNLMEGITAMNHAPNFRVDEKSMRIALERFATLILKRLTSENRQ